MTQETSSLQVLLECSLGGRSDPEIMSYSSVEKSDETETTYI